MICFSFAYERDVLVEYYVNYCEQKNVNVENCSIFAVENANEIRIPKLNGNKRTSRRFSEAAKGENQGV